MHKEMSNPELKLNKHGLDFLLGALQQREFAPSI
jgi:hypothetical protein